MNDDLNGRQSRDWDEGENATGRRFHPRSNENKELKEGAMPRRTTTIFSEVKSRGEKSKSTRLFVAAVRPIPATRPSIRGACSPGGECADIRRRRNSRSTSVLLFFCDLCRNRHSDECRGVRAIAAASPRETLWTRRLPVRVTIREQYETLLFSYKQKTELRR